ncbi:DUF2188 domain-containing protein [Paenibacillus gallinarum]|uniref:DUF2188 domain-containing protein n=1 Tax=Paenibacillus gallinarum TaxID=2762232 RepID=A0ABR8SX25_9BACL|nr:DUF2188 domain-containing protein [Paenibacillus gallinarum]MBD7967894.1 DUF2188 domain-containing protein [Paenibacillus gallinarum]
MPWNKKDYLPSMKNLEPRVRNKAIEIANALLGEGYEEGRSIAIATAQAEEWNENHPEGETKKHDKIDHSSPKKADSSAHAGEHRNIHVVPREDGWAVKKEGIEKPEHIYDVKDEAVKAAKDIVSSKNIRLIIHDKQGKIQTSKMYN